MRVQALRAVLLAVVVCAGVLAAGVSPATAAAPVVSSFSPVSGTIGTTVTITGAGFTGAAKVTFNTAASRFSIKSASKITATVPASASTGPIKVTTSGGTARSAKSFVVTPGVVLSVRTGPPTTTVQVSGAGFGAYKAVDLYFDTTDKALAATSGNGTFSRIPIRVPAAAVPGRHYITAVERHTGYSVQARFLVNTNWAQWLYSTSRTGVNPYENVLSRSNVSGMGLDWSFFTGGNRLGIAMVESSPAVANGVVYVGSHNGMYALDAATGAKRWSLFAGQPVIGQPFNSGPAVAGGLVYFTGGYPSTLYARDASTGAKRWSFADGYYVYSSPAVANGVVYVGTGEGPETGRFYAINAATGAVLWSFPHGQYFESPAVANGMVYIGTDNGNVYALNAATGAKRWSVRVEGHAYSPTVADGVVYVGSSDGILYALNATTGGELWRSFITLDWMSSSPAVANGVVYIGSSDWKVYALNAATGAVLWSFKMESPMYGSSPAVANGVVYVGSIHGFMYALNAATGARLWTHAIGNLIYMSSPAVANGVVYVGSDDGNVYAFGLPGGIAAINRPTPKQLHPNYALRP